MSESVNWSELEAQFLSSSVYRQKLAKMVNVVDGLDEVFNAGRKFVQTHDQSITALDTDLKEMANTLHLHNDTPASHSSSSSSAATPLPTDMDKISQIYKDIERLNVQDERCVSAGNPTNDTTFSDLIDKLKSDPIDTTKIKWWEREALQFMRGMMDECTHLKNFTVPYDTSLITAICAKDDAYVPREGCSSLEDIWPGAKVEYIDAGHVSGYMFYQKLIR